MTGHSHYKKGPCLELKDGPHFRSSWERNIYRVLLKMFPRVEYEEYRFKFDPPYLRNLDYLPDFFCYDASDKLVQLVEVKGWLESSSKSKLRGFKKHHPDALKSLIVVSSANNRPWIAKTLGCGFWSYNDVKREFSGFVRWE